jgi:hypothetical protein
MFWVYLVMISIFAYLYASSHGSGTDKAGTKKPGTERTEERERKDGVETSPFVYHPLPPDRLRLLEVLPTRLNGILRVRLTEHNLPASYRCVSYTWGSESDPKQILVNGQSLYVRRNLYDFLKMVATRFPNKPLWIDAICINQQDLLERAEQVQRMGSIYRDALEVLIWLGRDGSLIDTMRWINIGHWERPERLIIHGLKMLISHPYWERAWITQEVLMAREARILHGSYETDWVHIGPLIQTLINQEHPDAIYNFRTSHLNMLWKWQADHRCLPGFQDDDVEGADSIFWGVLSRRVISKCFDSRDRVYSLLALFRGNAKISVDYNEDAAGLFWRAGAELGAWSKHSYIRTLAGALNLPYTTLRSSLIDRSSPYVLIPVRQAYITSPLRSTGAMVCQNGHIKHSFPFPRTSRHDILLCPSTSMRMADDVDYTHALVQKAPDTDSFTIKLSHIIVYRKTKPRKPLQFELRHFSHDRWTTVTSWTYLQNNMKPELPSDTPVRWMLRLPMQWVIDCLGTEELTPRALLQLPTVEAEQLASIERQKWLSNESVKHKFARYATDTVRYWSTKAEVSNPAADPAVKLASQAPTKSTNHLQREPAPSTQPTLAAAA